MVNKTVGNGYFYDTLKKRSRYAAVFVLLAAAMAVTAVMSINTGNVNISVPDIIRIIFTKTGDENDIKIIWSIRLPRMIMSAVLGGALSVSGFLLQTYFENPIASPFVLGISSGAKMTVSLMLVYFLRRMVTISSFVMILASFAGALMSTGIILLVSKKIKRMSALLVAGIMIGDICSAVTDFIITFADDSDIANLHGWSKGSFSGMDWESVSAASLIVGVTVIFVFIMSKPIEAVQLGESYAGSMGVNIKLLRTAIIISSGILSASVTAFAGPVSFVGIAVPFLIKRALNTSKPIIAVPGIFLGGGVFCMICDLIARTVLAPVEMNISTVTAVFGAPVVIFIILRRKKYAN